MAPQEVILSASSSSGSASAATTTSGGVTSTPAVHLHDLLTPSHVHAFKPSSSLSDSVSFVKSENGVGGVLMAVQEGKSLVNVWAWQKDQLHMKIHLPEKLTCFVMSPNGVWAAGGNASGHVYLWEVASGLLLASFTPHYRSISTLTFTSDSLVLLTGSLDATVQVFMVSQLVDNASASGSSMTNFGGGGSSGGALGQRPYGTLGDHTLAIRAVVVGKTASIRGGRCLTASDDGTVKLWSLQHPFPLLTTFNLPTSMIPSALAFEPSERFFHVGTDSAKGEVFQVDLYRRKAEVGDAGRAAAVEAVGGGGLGSAGIKVEGVAAAVGSPVTALSHTMSNTHLLTGTAAGQIHVHSLPSHQLLRSINAHHGNGPVTYLTTLLKPPDLVAGAGQTAPGGRIGDAWPLMEVKPLERMRVGKAARDVQEVSVLLGPSTDFSILDTLGFDSAAPTAAPVLSTIPSTSNTAADLTTASRIEELERENKKLKVAFEKATRVNEKIWEGLVDLKMGKSALQNGDDEMRD